MSPLDPEAIHADDALLDTLGCGQDWLADDQVTEVLVAWRDDVDAAPIGTARHAAEPPRLEWLGSLARVLDPALSEAPRTRPEWRSAGSWAADKVEDLFSMLLIAGAVVVVAWALTAAVWVSPGWMRLLELVALATGWEVAVRLRRASRRIAELERDELEPSYAGWTS